jgi:hypothetical protein
MKISQQEIEWIRLMWRKSCNIEGTEVVKLVDDMTGKISILIKEKKSEK